MPTTFTDDMLGLITVHVNARARRIIMRPTVDGISVTTPPYTPLRTVADTLNRFRQELHARQLAMQKEAQERGGKGQGIDLGFRLESELVSLSLEEGRRKNFYLRAEPGKVVIVCPPETDFTRPERQEWLRRVVERALRQQAEQLLPERLRALSALHGLPFHTCKVNVSKGRWGSCSARRDINLSCYLVLLPAHLREYVMLHELCHTREMNHGPRFWALLDSLTDGRAKALQKELGEHRTGV